jgi:hypothetical protein
MLATVADARWNGLSVVADPYPEHDQRDRIVVALSSFGSACLSHKSTTNSRTAFFVCAHDLLRYQSIIRLPTSTTMILMGRLRKNYINRQLMGEGKPLVNAGQTAASISPRGFKSTN